MQTESSPSKFRVILNHKFTLIGVICAVLLAVSVMVWSLSANSGRLESASTAFYSDDDGVTWFTDSADKIMPFDHNGKPANGAKVFIGTDGKPEVGCLVRHTEAARRELKKAIERGEGAGSVAVQPFLEAKLPRSPSSPWIPDIDPKFDTVMHPIQPDGSPKRPLTTGN